MAALFAAAGFGFAYTIVREDRPVTYSRISEHFKYGSIGAERTMGIPRAVFLALPSLFADLLPGPGYASLGFLYEDGRELPVGISERRIAGVDFVAANCGMCHVGSMRASESDPPELVVGMPANTLDLGGFWGFLSQAASDSRFTTERILAEIDAQEIPVGWIERHRLESGEIDAARERLVELGRTLAFLESQPPLGPGRMDGVTATKVLFGMKLGVSPNRRVGTVDFPAVWEQGAKAGMSLYWDGSNDDVDERHMLGALYSGALRDAVDVAAVRRVRMYLDDAQAIMNPYRDARSDAAEQGKRLYAQYCTDCHGRGPESESPAGRYAETRAGQVTLWADVGTDEDRVLGYTEAVAEEQRTFRVGERKLERFEATDGYANVPLDGIWLRAPYLHNGSVPTLRDLLEPAWGRPRVFYRGSDVYDAERVGFESDRPEIDGRALFRFDTTLRGNSNRGHEGLEFGTKLRPDQKDALVEYLKGF